MLVDMRMVKAQTEYKRQRLSKSYKTARRDPKTGVNQANERARRRLRPRGASAV